jgi:hypothetical protein
MAEYQRIEYRIGKDGKIVETVIGGLGPTCIQAKTGLEAELGQVERRELLPEYEEGENTELETVSESL